MKIFIIESDTARQRQLRTILSSLGYKSHDIEMDHDGKRALNTLRKKRFDCVFAGLMTNEDVARFLKDVRSGVSTKNLPICIYASDVTKDRVVAAMESGATTFLSYPFSVNDVEAAIRLCASRAT